MGTSTDEAGHFRLSDFILQRLSQILAEWESRVRDLPVTEGLSTRALRDHIPELLDRIAKVVGTVHGGPPASLADLPDLHALERLDAGFDLRAAASELAVLRDVILEMWESEAAEAVTIQEVQRLSRAIDETMTRSVDRFARARERTLRALDQVSSAALGNEDLKTFLPRLLLVLLETTEAVDSVAIFLREPGDWLCLRAAVGMEEASLENFRLKIGDGFAGTIASKKEPLFLRDGSRDPLVVGPALRRLGIHALYGVPLIHDDEVIGIAHMGSRTAYEFSEEDKQLFRAMANRATALIVQTQLLDRLRVSEERLRLVVEASGAGTWELDARTNTFSGDERQMSLLGFQPDARVTLEQVLEAIHPDDRERAAAAIKAALAGENGGRYVIELRARALRRGGELWLEGRGQTQFNADGAPIRLIGTTVDITDRKRAEQEVVRRGEFAGELMAIVSHDLRSPISAILLSAGTLLRRWDLDPRQRGALERMISSAQRATRMIGDLLDFTRAQVGSGIPVERTRFDFDELAAQVVDEVRLVHPDREVQVSWHGSGEGEWDADRLAQIVTNLLSNALQHSPDGSSVRVTSHGDAQQVVLEFWNEGAICEADLSRLFQPYQRGRGAGKGGIGLGLYIARQLVEAHGGRVEVRSSEADGTTFTVTLPRAEGSATTAS